MFCSRCGKTIYSSDDRCKHCGQPVGVNRFMGTAEVAAYTAAQTWEEAPQVERDAMEFTRTSYMSDAQAEEMEQEERDVTRSTVYRPVLRENEAQGRTNRTTVPEMPAEEEAETAASAEAVETAKAQTVQAEPAAQPKNEEAEQETPRPRTQIRLTPVKRTGISPEVLAHMSDLDENIRKAEEKASRKSAAAAASVGQSEEADMDTDESEETAQEKPARKFQLNIKFPAFGRRTPEEDEDDEEEQEDSAVGQKAEEATDSASDDEEEEDGESFLDRITTAVKGAGKKLSAMGRKKQMQMGGIALAVVLVLVVGCLWLGRVTADKAKIDGVSYSVYSQGIALLEKNSTQEYFDGMLDLYNTNLLGVQGRFDEELDAVKALLPEKPAENDQAFIDTVYTMQSSLHTTATIYALSEADGAAETLAADFQREWKKMTDAIGTLKAATEVSALQTIAQAAQVSITDQFSEEDQVEDEASKYIKLTKGMMNSNDVYVMQERLVELGYLEGECDGSFGSKTELAVKRFQKAAGLETDGIVTPEMQVLMYSDDAPRRAGAGNTQTTAPTQAPTEATTMEEAAPAPAQEG